MDKKPNVAAGTCILTQDMTTGTMLETYGITDICQTRMPAEVRPARIAVDPVLWTNAPTGKMNRNWTKSGEKAS